MRASSLPGLLITALALAFFAGCSVIPYGYENSGQAVVESRAIAQQQGRFRISASVPSREEAQQLFGVPLHKRGIQAVWLEVFNSGTSKARFVPFSIDPKYFPPHEVAYMFRKSFSTEGWKTMERRFVELSLPRYIGPGETVSGYVFTHEEAGTKAFNVDVFYIDQRSVYEHFTFFVTVPGFKPDHAKIEFATLYTPAELIAVDTDGLRRQIAELPCCTSDSQGAALGQPVKMFIAAEPLDLLQALLRSGWSETGYERGPAYLSAADHYFGRPADAIFRKKRDASRSTERNEIGVWLTPIRVDGRPLWAVQIKHAIGRRFQLGEQFLGVRLDPDTDDGRNYLLQNLWYSHALEQFAWSATGKPVSYESPVLDFNDNAWFSDGLRVVVWVSGDPVSLADARSLDWDRPVDYLPVKKP